jgi:hypothetical protein
MATRSINIPSYNRLTSGIVTGQPVEASHQINNYTAIENFTDPTETAVEAHEKSFASIERQNHIQTFDDAKVSTGVNTIAIDAGATTYIEVDSSGTVTTRTGWAANTNIDVSGISGFGVMWAVYPALTYQATSGDRPTGGLRVFTFNNNAGTVTVNPKTWESSIDADRQTINNPQTFNFPVTLNAGVAGAAGGEVNNWSLAASVASNALTVNLRNFTGITPSLSSPVNFNFRSSTLTIGRRILRQVTAALSITIPSGTTLGSVNNDNSRIYVYAIDNSGTIELALSMSPFIDTSTLQNTLAISGGAIYGALYSTSARSNVPVVLLGYIIAPQATAGVWASAPTTNTLLNREQMQGRVLIQEQIISSPVASVDFTRGITSAFNKYDFDFLDVKPATDDAFFYCRVSSNAGTSYDSGASDYNQAGSGVWSNASFTTSAISAQNTSQGFMSTASAAIGVSSAANEAGYCGTLSMYNPSNTSRFKQFIGTGGYNLASDNFNIYVQTSFVRKSSSAINAIRFFFSTGNVASGLIRLYGVN